MSIFDQFNARELAILKARAERIANALDDDQSSEALTALVVTVRNEQHALPIDAILNVYEDLPIVPVPCAAPYVAGIANVRGHIMPVLDLAILLAVPGEARREARSLVVASTHDLTVAFTVEQIGEVVSLMRQDLKPVTGQPSGLASHLQGVLADGTVLLDVAALLSDPELIIDEVVS